MDKKIALIIKQCKKHYRLLKRVLIVCESWRHVRKLQPPSSRETKLIENLRRKINQLESRDIIIENEWVNRLNQLRQNVKNKDPRGFLQWEVIRQTMFHECREAELNYLKKMDDWSVWEMALQESAIGCPRRYPKLKSSSGNLIHGAYHLARFLSFNNLNVAKLDTIFEFGGGYGSLCQLFYKLGFQGKYIVYDLPEFSLLQEYFLKSLNMNLNVTTENTSDNHKTVALISDVSKLAQHLPKKSIDMLIATWSLSESPISLRQNILKTIGNPDNYLIAYQENFSGANNAEYFSNLIRFNPNYTWQRCPIAHLPPSHYLFGKKNNDQNNSEALC